MTQAGDITHPPSPFKHYSKILPHYFTFFHHSPTIFPQLINNKKITKKNYNTTNKQTHSQNSIILFIITFYIYLIPHITINFFYYPNNKIYNPNP